jgi:hypothetical protein
MRKISELEKLEPRYLSLLGLMRGNDDMDYSKRRHGGRVLPTWVPE